MKHSCKQIVRNKNKKSPYKLREKFYKKGFTLIELLGVLIILSAIVLLVFPSILNQMKKSQGKINEASKEMFFTATDLYLNENQNQYGYIKGDTYCITLDTLVKDGKLRRPLKDSSGKELDGDMFVQAKVVDGKEIEYQFVEKCIEVNTTPSIPDDPDVIPGSSKAPKIEFTGSNLLSDKATTFDVLEGVIITDDNTPVSEIEVTIIGEVSLGVSGKYPIVYKAVDKDLNETTEVRIIEVLKTEYVFDYTGSYQDFVVPRDGTYQVELWGAGYAGAYTSGIIQLKKDETFYLYVGQNSQSCSVYTQCGGAFNGGGAGGYFTLSTYLRRGPSGGGATDLRYFENVPSSSELAWNSSLGLRSRIMVAGGSSSALNSENYSSAGGLKGGDGIKTTGGRPGGGGTQTSGGTSSKYTGSFGIGGTGYISYPNEPNNNEGFGGGGGYYGGGGGYGGGPTSSGGLQSSHGEGGSGSSFISGYLGCVAITSQSDTTPKSGCSDGTNDIACSYHYSGKIFTSPSMKSGNDKEIPNYDHTGFLEIGTDNRNGYAKITLLDD